MEVITLNKDEFSKKCVELISQIDVKPQLIVGILNGGGFVTREMQSHFKSSHFELVKQQRQNRLKSNKVVRGILKLLPYKVLNWLRVLESKKVKKSIEYLNEEILSKEEINFEYSTVLKKPIETILIVDDAIDTGKTMFFVKNSLAKQFPNVEIKIAVVSWTLETSIVKPDFFIFKNILVRFPWSKDYKGKDRF